MGTKRNKGLWERGWMMSLAIVVCTLMPIHAVLGQEAGAPAGFEIDGNQLCGDDFAGAGVGDDWADNSSEGCDGVVDPFDPQNGAQFTDCNWGSGSSSKGDPTQFKTGSNKNCDLIAEGQDSWVYTSNGGGPQKNDITNVYVHTRKACTSVKPLDGTGSFTDCTTDADCTAANEMCHNWVIVGAETRSTNGDSHLDFEVNQAGVELTGGDGCQHPLSCCQDDVEGMIIGNGPAATGGRTVGDISLDMSFVRGGSEPVLTVRTWDGDSYNFVTGQLAGVTVFSQTNESSDINSGSGWHGFNSNGSDNTTSPDIAALQFVEGAINQTALGVDFPGCIVQATMLVKSRSSHSDNDVDFCNAQLKDFALFPFPSAIPPTCRIAGDDMICANDTDSQSSQFCAIPQVGGSDVDSDGYDDFTYLWETGETTRCIDAACPVANSPCNFEVTVTEKVNGCVGDPCNRDLNVTPKPSCSINDPTKANVLTGTISSGTGPYTCTAQVTSGNGWSVDAVNGCVVSGSTFTVNYSVSQPADAQATFMVTITDDEGCTTMCQKVVLFPVGCVSSLTPDDACGGNEAQFCAKTNSQTLCVGADDSTDNCVVVLTDASGTDHSSGAIGQGVNYCIDVTTAGCYTATVTDALGFDSANACKQCAIITAGASSSCP